MTHESFSYKRIGYIGAGVLLDEDTELNVLVTHTITKDLQNPDPNIQCLALTFIANNGSPEVCRSVASEAKKCLTSNWPRVLKMAGMAIVRIIRKNPDLSSSFKNSVQKLLNHHSHCVILSGMNLVIEMIQAEPKFVYTWHQFVTPFTKILKNLANSRGSREFSYSDFCDPYMLIKTLKILALLGKTSDELESILQTIISSVDTKKNTGCAILYQAVDTIVSISAKPALRGLGFNQIGRLLSTRKSDVIYSALSAFARVLYHENVLINRGGVDSMALQRHRNQVVKCLRSKDPSIRRRALDVISALIDEQNIVTLVPEIFEYVHLTDPEFCTELITKIYNATQRFAPSLEWYFDTVFKMLKESGSYISSDIVASFCELVSKTPELQNQSIQKLTVALNESLDNQTLLQVASFVLGEFAPTDNGITDSMKRLLTLPQTKTETKLYIITALSKMATRFGTTTETSDFLRDKLESSNNLEIQQRAGEMRRLLLSQSLCAPVLTSVSGAEISSEEKTANIGYNTNNDDLDDDLLSLVMDTPAPTTTPTPAKNTTSGSLIDDLLGSSIQSNAPPGADELLRKADYIVYGQKQMNPNDKRQIALRIIVKNATKEPMTNIKTEYEVTDGWKIMVQQQSSNVIRDENDMMMQVIYLLQEEMKQFALKFKIEYSIGNRHLTDVSVITKI
ncbi:Adaptin N terminal region family protein [Histomonas meleagridis]|uniref:Adaptin N terminal region family protein n=1 Tax=Histomonas meleagridis TaxID=135588 RepID=UPI003559AE2B|nr:Adaptin N terminal region family protein [Histomonas meleagridis]KAH0800886.1 Adaptin N terminal region family protein [Histomonas meleagridis]